MGGTCLLVIFTVFTFSVSYSESRVYCQDKNAQSWMRFGYACPVTCTSITDAIKKLKYFDLKKALRHELGRNKGDKVETELKNNHKIQKTHGQIRQNLRALIQEERVSDNILHGEYINTKEKNFEYKKKVDKKSSNSNYILLADIENNDINIGASRHGGNEGITKEYFDTNNQSNDIPDVSRIVQNLPYGCWSVEKYDVVDLKFKLMSKICTRRSNFDGRLLRIMTKILNKYIKSPFVFTEGITEILLEKVFAKQTDLRNDIFDVDNLMKYLRQAIPQHDEHTYNQKIVLQSQHCLFMSLPGCYCRPGFVENLGQCVMPIDCDVDEKDRSYLIRIVVQ